MSCPSGLLQHGQHFWTELRAVKQSANELPFSWYPFESLSALPLVAELLDPASAEVSQAIASHPVADIGCADGDFSLLMARLGADVDAIDFAPNNYNRMQAVEWLSREMGLPVHIHSLDLDRNPTLPREHYGLTLFLGTLYHLKNPYLVLESLAYRTEWCLLSTRIAQVTANRNIRMEEEPLAYLVSGRELANDATNYWIFSACGLLRILQRTRWAIAGLRRVGCSQDSNPLAGDADERMFLLLKSRVFYPQLQAQRLDGWYAPEDNERCWTTKRFSLGVTLPLERPIGGFMFRAYAPGGMTLECCIGGEPIHSETYETPGDFTFRSPLPPYAAHEPILKLDFSVESTFAAPGDTRELGICVPLGPRIPFEVW